MGGVAGAERHHRGAATRAPALAGALHPLLHHLPRGGCHVFRAAVNARRSRAPGGRPAAGTLIPSPNWDWDSRRPTFVRRKILNRSPILHIAAASGQAAPTLLGLLAGSGTATGAFLFGGLPTHVHLLYTSEPASCRAVQNIAAALPVERFKGDRDAAAVTLPGLAAAMHGERERRLKIPPVCLSVEQVPAYDARAVVEQISACACAFLAAAGAGARVRIDATGGTKLMSFGARDAMLALGDDTAELLYVNTERREYQVFDQQRGWRGVAFPNVFEELPTAGLAAAYGFHIQPLDSFARSVMAPRRALVRALLTDPALFERARRIRDDVLHAQREGRSFGKVAPIIPRDATDRRLVDLALAAKAIKRTGTGLAPGSPADTDARPNETARTEALRFWAGSWLEYAVLDVISDLAEDPALGISDVVQGRRFGPLPWIGQAVDVDKGEVDVAAVCRGLLVLFECKDWWLGNAERTSELTSQAYKVEFQREKLGGKYAVASIVTSGDGDADQRRLVRRRCESMGIAMIEIQPGSGAHPRLKDDLRQQLEVWRDLRIAL